LRDLFLRLSNFEPLGKAARDEPSRAVLPRTHHASRGDSADPLACRSIARGPVRERMLRFAMKKCGPAAWAATCGKSLILHGLELAVALPSCSDRAADLGGNSTPAASASESQLYPFDGSILRCDIPSFRAADRQTPACLLDGPQIAADLIRSFTLSTRG
jgi:hypothetical protein